MLRRPPTAIKLTREDIAMYEDRKKEQEKEAGRHQEKEGNPHDGVKLPVEAGKKGGKSREERIGVSGGAGGR